jgi:hypothetical protein
MNRETLRKGQKVMVERDGDRLDAVVAKTTPFKAEFPFVLVEVVGGSKLLVHRARIRTGKEAK